MSKKTLRNLIILALALILIVVLSITLRQSDMEDAPYFATFMSLVPPLIAIGLALLTKEVYSSLFVGVLAGGLFAADFHPVKTFDHVVNDG